jgi:hypothetical protein
MSQPTPVLVQRRRNGALFAGVALLFLTILSNVPSLYALKPPGVQTFLPWVNLVLPGIALLCFIVGLKRAFSQPSIYGGKIWGSIVGALSLLLFAGSIWGYRHAKDLPVSSAAPRIGQKAPDFTLNDTSGNQVSLSELLKTPIDASAGKAPKAVLLIFYRGYW